MAEPCPWHTDPYDDDPVLAFLEQESARMQQILRQERRQIWVMNWSLVGFNLGMGLANSFWYSKGDGWGYGVAAVVHGLAGGYATSQLWRLWRRQPGDP